METDVRISRSNDIRGIIREKGEKEKEKKKSIERVIHR